MEKTAAVILAAGGSSRLGRPKQFLIHRGKTLLEHAVDAAAECFPAVVVAGRDRQRVEVLLHNQRVSIVDHVQWELGIGSSIRAGVARVMEIAANVDSLIILLCDQPYVTASLVASLRDKQKQERKPIVACRYGDSPGVPALFDRSVFPQLQTLQDRSGAKEILLQSRHQSQIPFPGGAVDIDTPADSLRYLDDENQRKWKYPHVPRLTDAAAYPDIES